MGLKECIIFFLILFLSISLVSANNYSIDYTQVDNQVVIKEGIDGVESSNYVLEDLLEKNVEGYYFVKKIIFNESYDCVEIKINLDIGFIFGDEAIFPFGYKTYTDGQTISASWKLNNVNAGDIFPIFVKIKNINLDYDLLWGLLIVLLIGAIIYPFYRKKHSKSSKSQQKKIKSRKKIKKDYDYLLETEKRVINELKKANRNELWQKQIQNSTNFSKAKVSRVVRNLEARGLVNKIPFGNTNKIRLK